MSIRRRRHAERKLHRSCVAKRRYPTRQRARLIITVMRATRPRWGDARLEAYWCGVCLAWHVGHGQKEKT